ncbi:citrate/2-methylcitrate synthase [Aquihabitans daechungensis]|uniref:citrate/2-methylcitrate synthase n=1 Tax=Aquihabitans daechungensis TaxID=1052257 RepID=UPI003B9EC0F9
MSEDLTAKQVADRLGVELATVYAYASRGSLRRRPAADGRTSVYDADEVELLARRARPRSTRRRAGAVDVVIGTTVSEIGDGWIRYRDQDLIELVSWCTFEDACELLWTGELSGHAAPDRAEPHDAVAMTAAVEAAVEALPAGASISARLVVGTAAASPWIPRAKTTESSIRSAGRVIDALIASLPLRGAPVPVDAPVAARLWPKVSALDATPGRLRALDTVLVLLAEHELATSTLAVRVAASTRAKPAEAVQAGLATASGPFHGGAAVRVHRRLIDGLGPVDDAVIAGFGHPVHETGDPRFAPAIERVLPIAKPRARAAIETYVRAHPPGVPPNIDAALAGLAFAAEAEPGITEAVFVIARTAGWLAHAFEEADEVPVRFRGRTLYRGPR